MKNIKFLTHPLVVLLTVVSFIVLVSGCETKRPVTVYDKDGKPHTEYQEDPWAMIGWGIIIIVTVACLAACAAGNSTTSLGTEKDARFASCKISKGALGHIDDSMIRDIKIVDREGNLLLRQKIDFRSAFSNLRVLNMREMNPPSYVDKNRITSLLRKALSVKNGSMPWLLEANVTIISRDTIQINSVDSLPYNETKTLAQMQESVMTINPTYGAICSYTEKDNAVESNSRKIFVTIGS